MPTRSMRGVALVLVATMITGCATIMNRTTQTIGITSRPSGAAVSIDGASQGVTPVIAKLERKRTHAVLITLDGYQPFETTIKRRVSGWVLGNILFGGLIGLVIDTVSGGLYTLTPDQISAEMKRAGASARLQPDTLYVAVVMQPRPEWKKIGQLAQWPAESNVVQQ